MTKCVNPVTRETLTTDQHRPLIATLTPRMLRLRQKGKRKTISVPYDAIWHLGWKLEQREIRAAKLAAKPAKLAAKRGAGHA